jgi:hypothetical protein
MEAAGRLLHRDWTFYDPAQAVFRPKHMTPEELELRAAVLASVDLAAAPEDWRAAPTYLAMSYLYKRSNWLWHLSIQRHLVHAVWRPLVELTRVRHLRFRARLAEGRWPGLREMW